jgi:menaquinone-dependent protoporphyrinogen oxidase
MSRVQVVYASRHGGTTGIADRIAEVLRAEGVGVMVADAARKPDPDGDFDGYVVGSGVYMGSWLKEGLEFLERHQEILVARPVWLFSSGPLPGSSKETVSADPLEVALGPKEGPGSGGHRRIVGLAEAVGARDHRVFLGAFDPSDPPGSLSERVVRLMPASRKILPPGDFRDWDAIEAWAREIAASLAAEVPVA